VVELWIERFTHRDLPLLRSAAQAAKGSEPLLMATVLGRGGVTRRVMHAATPAFLPPNLRSSAEALLEPDTAERVRYIAQHGENLVLLERLNLAGTDLWLYGAGHVGQALVRVLAELPVRITWIDSRAEFLPRRVAPNVRTIHSLAPAEEALSAPRSARHLVMTHDHALDYEICRSLLRRYEPGSPQSPGGSEDGEGGSLAWLGLIGSASKGAKFRSRLQREGLSQVAIDRLVCPIGVDGVEGKAPSIIAISVAAQLLKTLKDPAEIALPRERRLASRTKAPAAKAMGDPSRESVVAPLPQYARERVLDGCPAENCDSCGTRQRASV
jgi:xanthine dehydrogenase accessory factor